MTTYTDSAYVAWGVDFETDPEGSRYWVAVWDDDGPQSVETFRSSRESAKIAAENWASEINLEAVEVDEFGAVVTPA